MLSRRSLLSVGAAAPVLSAGLGAGAFAQENVSDKIKGQRQTIVDVKSYVIRIPGGEPPMDQRISMPPIGTMRETVGLGARLDHATPSRFFGRMQTLLVRIETDQGLVGWGEAHAPAAPTVHRQLISHLFAPVLIGQNALDILPLWERMYSTQRMRGFSSAGFFSESLAGVDIALWDILGKHLGVPLYQLLGGKFRDRIPTYKAVRDPGDARTAIREGFAAVKTGFFKGAGSGDIDRIAGLSRAVGDKGQVFVDSLGAFKLHEAIEIGRELDRLGNIGWFEDALLPEEYGKYSILAEALDTAVCAGETFGTRFQFLDLFKNNGVDVINPDLGRAGGITECKRIADLADVFGVLWSPHVSSGFPPYVAASIHLAAATPNAVMMEAGDIHSATSVNKSRGNVLLKKPLKFEPGYAYVPEGPGLGIEFDEALLKEIIDQE